MEKSWNDIVIRINGVELTGFKKTFWVMSHEMAIAGQSFAKMAKAFKDLGQTVEKLNSRLPPFVGIDMAKPGKDTSILSRHWFPEIVYPIKPDSRHSIKEEMVHDIGLNIRTMLQQLEEKCVKKVLRTHLQREPTMEDARQCTAVRRVDILDRYGLLYQDKPLGMIVKRIDHKPNSFTDNVIIQNIDVNVTFEPGPITFK
jgi:hypothetical protein